MAKNILFWLIAAISFISVSCIHEKADTNVVELNNNWKFKAVDDSLWLPATVPGSVHTDLMNNGVIEAPFYRLNELDVQWVDKKSWEYTTTFDISSAILNRDVVEMIFKGLDTYATVFLNGKEVLVAYNMFISWKVDCKSYLKEGENNLKIVFDSPIEIGLEKREALGFWLPGAENDQSERGGVGDKKTCVFTRKAQYHYGWDWGPRLVSSGIWQPVLLKAWDVAEFNYLHVVQKSLNDKKAEIVLNTKITAVKDAKLSISVQLDNQIVASQSVSLKKGENNLSLPVTIVNPELWWTNGLGEQKLYNIKLQIKDNFNIISDIEENIGLRTLKLIQKHDSVGSSFYFELNGRPVFAKGANYIPQDVFLNRVSESDYEDLIVSAADVNMNMLRVWGGGIYEKDIFYNLCDKYGILVWQDFMFACAMYPGNDEFLSNVEKEAIQNVRRIRNHPCLALWCGDNEILIAWNRWGWQQQSLDRQDSSYLDTIWHAYDTVFHHILPEIVNKYDPQTSYWASSPSAGIGELEDGKSGDRHYWGVWWAKEPFEKYKEEIPRFMSEYGFQSFPEFNSVKKYTLPEDHDIYSEVMKSHQRSSIGNKTIDEYMKRDYRDPKDFEMYLYVNQVLQANGIKTAIEAHRRSMPYCMGSLYWQLNDCWPVASWSGMDYYGNWKAMHYFAKKAFKNILVSPVTDSLNNTEVYIVSDKSEAINGVLMINIISFLGDTLFTETSDVYIPANSSDVFFRRNFDEYVANADQVVLNTRLLSDDGGVMAYNNMYFLPVKDLSLPAPVLKYSIREEDSGFIIDITTENLAKNVFLSFPDIDCMWSDNYFDMLPGERKEVFFIPEKDITTDEILLRTIDKSFRCGFE